MDIIIIIRLILEITSLTFQSIQTFHPRNTYCNCKSYILFYSPRCGITHVKLINHLQ